MSPKKDWVNFALQRPNYFPGQYLLDEDFELAHRYLDDRQRYVNRRLHLAGIVEGLEVEAIAGQAEVIIKSGTAIDGEGNLIILKEAVTRKINSLGWLCLHYKEEPKILQQPEIPDSYTRFEETPTITLEAIQSNDTLTITLAKVLLQDDQVIVDASVRQYSGVRLPSATQDIELRSDGQDLRIQGNLTVSGALQLGSTLIEEISQSIPAIDRPNVIPSEKAVKDHIAAALANAGKPTGEAPAVRLDQKDGKMVGWKIKGSEEENDPTASLRLLSSENGVEKPRLTIERDTGLVIVHETLRVQNLEVINPMRHRMYPAAALSYGDLAVQSVYPTIIYQDIFEAEKARVIEKWKLTNNYDNKSRTSASPYFNRSMILYGRGKEDEAGALLTVPTGYDTVWVRNAECIDSWHIIKAEYSENGKSFIGLGNWAAGRRNANHYCPDGSLSDSSQKQHQWLPIPVGKSGKVSLVHKQSGTEFWLSGVAFSTNPWSHATQSAVGYHWQINGGDAISWNQDKYNDDILATINAGVIRELRVPIVPSGRDKLLFMILHNDGWNGATHTGITVTVQGKDIPVERFLSTYDNPFARHWNSKVGFRYMAARIPAQIVADALQQTGTTDRMTQYLSVKIDTSKNTIFTGGGSWGNWEDALLFREVGTHDLELPHYL